MAKLENILLLVNLLHHRRCVSLETMKKMCGVSNRTLFRYIQTISGANIPIYYDRDLGGYRLLDSPGMQIDNINIDEAIIVAFALRLLSKRVNIAYNDSIIALIKKVCARQAFILEDLWSALDEQENTGFSPEDLSELITSQVINAAVLHGRKLKVSLGDGNLHDRVVEIDKPTLRFSKGWKIVPKQHGRDNKVYVRDIVQASIIET
jgi:predicted DNA-binding transcriptional regulator YafY